jgi:hypothetical protein
MTSSLFWFSDAPLPIMPLNQFKIIRRRSMVAAQETIHE